jgi:hypothetical protein
MKPLTLRIGLTFAAVLLLLPMSVASAGDDQGQVMVTRPGVVFHLAGAHDFHGRAVGRSMEAALAAGYTPCPVCFGKTAPSGTVAHPGAAATAAFGNGAVLAPVTGPTAEAKAGYGESRGGSRVMATGCTSHDAVCPYGLPFRTTPGL